MEKIIIHVSGGCVQAVYTDENEVTVELCDWDNANVDEEEGKRCEQLDQECFGLAQVF